MARQLTITNEDDFRFLKHYIEQWQGRAHTNISGYSEYVDRFDRLAEDFLHAKPVANPSEQPAAEQIASPPAARRPKDQRTVDPLPNYCPEHPHYQAKRSPRTECETCWMWYAKLNPTRSHLAKAKFARKRAS